MREIELKAKVDDSVSVEALLSSFLEFDGRFEKNDEYWSVTIADSPSRQRQFRLRLRIENGRGVVTSKEKSYGDIMEVNEEIEFGVDDPDSFRAVLKKMGAKLLYTKRKKGGRWRGEGNLQAELVTVEGLGVFLEVEVLQDDSEKPALKEIEERLIGVLRRCGLGRKDIVSKPYSQLLGFGSLSYR